MSDRIRTNSVLKKLGLNTTKKPTQQLNEKGQLQTWIHPVNQFIDSSVSYNAKYLGSIEVIKPKGVEIVKDAIKKLTIARQVKKSEFGHKGSKLQKVEISININTVKIVDIKSKAMVCSRPLHRISYCADDHADKKLFAFIAKDQETKKHNCFAFVCEKEAAELTFSFGQAFQLAYKRYIEKEKNENNKTRELLSLEKQIEEMKSENKNLKKELQQKKEIEEPGESNGWPDNASVSQTSSPHSPVEYTDPFNLLSLSTPLPNCESTDVYDFQTISNPCPTSPESFTSNFPAFNTSSSVTTDVQNDIFDPFSNINSSQVSDSSFPTVGSNVMTSTTSPLGLLDNNYRSIDMFNQLGTSPSEEDFYTKSDPFADVPDWKSVASEESLSTTNPFMNEGSMMPQHFDPFNNQSYNNSNGLVEDQQPSFQENNTLFSHYLSNVVASREPRTGNSFSDDNIFSKNSFSTFENESQEMNVPNDFFSSITTNSVSEDTNRISPTSPVVFPADFDNAFPMEANNSQTGNDSFVFNTSNSTSTSVTTAGEVNTTGFTDLAPRPRPSGIGIKNQSLPAPPTKKDILTISKSTPEKKKTSLSREPASPVYNPPTPNQQKPSMQFRERIVSSSHILPNVEKVRPAGRTDVRMRTASIQNAEPLKDSISRASKSLDDLMSSDVSNNSAEIKSHNPFVTQGGFTSIQP